MPRTSQLVRFPGGSGHVLEARWERPEGSPRAQALLAHCFGCTKTLKSISWISRRLAERGVAVLRFDFTGLGGSRGDFSRTNLSTQIADIRAAGRFLEGENARTDLLIGHSLGGIAMVLAARQFPGIQGIITIASASDLSHLRTIIERYPPSPTDGSRVLSIGGHRRIVRPAFLEDLDRHDVMGAVENLKTPRLVIHSRSDELVEFSHAERLKSAAGSNGSLLALEEVDHLLTDRVTAQSVADRIVGWVENL